MEMAVETAEQEAEVKVVGLVRRAENERGECEPNPEPERESEHGVPKGR